MSLNQDELLNTYRDLHQSYPDDLHLARPLIQMLQAAGATVEARDLAMQMARRMLALGRSGNALGFLEVCKQLKHPDQSEITSIQTMADLTSDVSVVETNPNQRFLLIDQLSDAEGKEFLSQGKLVHVPQGQDIIHQGEVDDRFYIILSGRMHVHLLTETNQDVNLNDLQAGQFFGEFACIYQLPRSATVTASEPCLLLEFSSLTIEQLMHRSPLAGDRLMSIVRKRLVQSVALTHPAMDSFTEADRKWLADITRIRDYQAGELIPVKPDEEKAFCILIFGSAIIEPTQPTGAPLAELKAESLFGDAHPWLDIPEDTQIRARERCLVACVPESIFSSFMRLHAKFDYWIKMQGEKRKALLQGASETA